MILLEVLLGVCIGFVFGLIPNFHINLVAYLFLLISFFSVFPNHFILFISIGLAHLITGYIPTALLGVPTESSIMHIFPLQKFFQKGESKSAIILCLVGSFFGMMFSLLFLPFLFLLFSVFFEIYWFIALAIIFVLFLFVYQEKNSSSRLIVFFIILISGLLGLFTLKYNFFFKDPLIVCVSGLFAFPILITSLFNKSKFILQSQEVLPFPKKSIFFSLIGSLSSLLIILIPSFSSTQAGTIVNKFLNKLKSNEYIILYSSISISALIFSIFLAISFSRPRLGYIAILLSENMLPISFNFILGLVIFLSVCLTILLVYVFLNKIIDFINNSNLFLLNLITIIVSFLFIIGFSGFSSIPLLLLSITIGFLPIIFNKSKVILMAYLMIPTLLFYI